MGLVEPVWLCHDIAKGIVKQIPNDPRSFAVWCGLSVGGSSARTEAMCSYILVGKQNPRGQGLFVASLVLDAKRRNRESKTVTSDTSESRSPARRKNDLRIHIQPTTGIVDWALDHPLDHADYHVHLSV